MAALANLFGMTEFEVVVYATFIVNLVGLSFACIRIARANRQIEAVAEIVWEIQYREKMDGSLLSD